MAGTKTNKVYESVKTENYINIQDIEDIIESGHVTNNGPRLEILTENIADFTNKHVSVCSSGESALILMLKAEGVGPGSVVGVPSFTFIGTVQAILWCGGTPYFMDYALEPFGMEVDNTLPKELTHILFVENFGFPENTTYIQMLKRDFQDVCFLCDSAPAFGSKDPFGNIGSDAFEAQIYSFHATKPYSTIEGGAVVSKWKSIIGKIDTMKNFGLPYGTFMGLNAKMSELHASIGLSNLDHFTTHTVPHKNNMYWQYRKALLEIGVKLPNPYQASPSLLPIIVPTFMPIFVENRQAVRTKLSELGVETEVYFRTPCHLHPVFHKYYKEKLPVTEYLSEHTLCLPFHNDFDIIDIQNITERVKQCLSSY